MATAMMMMMMTMMMTTMMMMTMMVDLAHAKDITCTAAATGNTTDIICDFGVDIEKEGLSFKVQYYPPSPDLPDTVLACNHNGDTKKFDCPDYGGVKFHGVIGTEVRLTQPTAPAVKQDGMTSGGGGQYLCQLVPSLDGVKSQFCNITVKDTRPKSTTHDPTDSHSSSDIDYEHADFVMSIFICILLFFIVACIIVAIVFCVCGYRNPTRLFRWWSKQKEAAAKVEDPITGMEEQQPTQESNVDEAEEVQEMKEETTGGGGSRFRNLLSCIKSAEGNSDNDNQDKKGGAAKEPDENDKMLQGAESDKGDKIPVQILN